MANAHFVGQAWHAQGDERYSIHLQWVGYSVPMYCCYFCFPNNKMLACCRSLDKAFHAREVLIAESVYCQ